MGRKAAVNTSRLRAAARRLAPHQDAVVTPVLTSEESSTLLSFASKKHALEKTDSFKNPKKTQKRPASLLHDLDVLEAQEKLEEETAARVKLEEKLAVLETQMKAQEIETRALTDELTQMRAAKVHTKKAEDTLRLQLQQEQTKPPLSDSYHRAVEHWKQSASGQTFKKDLILEFRRADLYQEDQARYWADGFNRATYEIQKTWPHLDIPYTFNGKTYLRTGGKGLWDDECPGAT